MIEYEFDPALTEKQKYDIRQVIATLEIENLHVSESDIRSFEDVALGRNRNKNRRITKK